VNQTLTFGKPVPPLETLQKLNAVTISNVKDLAARILETKVSVITVGKCDCAGIAASLEANGLKV